MAYALQRALSLMVSEFHRSVQATLILAAIVCGLCPAVAWATPSTTFWAPATATCQAWAVPHVTYDTYFAKGGGYPVNSGLTSGFLPFEEVQGEAGFDLFYPAQESLYLNAKLCTPESSVFEGSPALSFGIFLWGFEKNVSDYNVLHLMAQRSLPWGGYVAAGVYHGLSDAPFINSEGVTVRNGVMAALTSPDIQIGLKGLKKIRFAADIQTGKNILGAWGVGTYVYFAENVSLLAGPVFFLDEAIQPGGSGFMWTLQLDLDVSLDRL